MEMKAREAFAAGRYDEALETFAKLYAESLHPVYLRNIGRCHQKMREPQKAIDAFQDYLAKAKKITAEERSEIEGYIREMEAMRDAQAQAQATPPAVATPPTRTAAAAAPPPSTLPAAPPPAQTEGSLVTAPPPAAAAEPSSPFYTRWWFWTAVGVVVAGGVTAAVLLSRGTTRPGCTGAQECM
jgi:tetratricopeptide (TPR) repeat protein